MNQEVGEFSLTGHAEPQARQLPDLSSTDQAELEHLVNAVQALNPQPRAQRWRSLTYCLVDAVWSIGARYDTVVVPLVRRVAHEHGDGEPLVDTGTPLPRDPAPLRAFLARFGPHNPLTSVTNRQRTSTRGGALKADVARRYAEVLLEHGVGTLADVAPLMRDARRFEHVNDTLRRLPGEGQHGVRRNYLWMLAGDDDGVKPDRMVLRWFARHGQHVEPLEAAMLVRAIADRLTELGHPTTPWEVDHAIWSAQRAPRHS
ncbi:hypothetical protein CLV35_2636 [Motilibacter peucedani]|uniref:Heme peroxidase n=1 Tax=Motilibacter peucedani TaxID=598650 RepID=A0A420XPM6_9ACTN|nr:hypothetical protein [Motilibacter peucedani]RKS74134.1 hypothetical protein CLV35_2636 [Motilibacter peucedani]